MVEVIEGGARARLRQTIYRQVLTRPGVWEAEVIDWSVKLTRSDFGYAWMATAAAPGTVAVSGVVFVLPKAQWMSLANGARQGDRASLRTEAIAKALDRWATSRRFGWRANMPTVKEAP